MTFCRSNTKRTWGPRMDKRKCLGGQTLVELAIVLPCFCLGVFMAVQLMTYCHNMIELERMAQLAIDRLNPDTYGERTKYSLFNSLWGNFSPPQIRYSSEMPQPWRPFHGPSTVKQEGRFFNVKVSMLLMPGAGFSSVLDTVKQESFGETYLEPPVPQEE